MKEITLQRFHDILYKFFAVLTCLGFFMLAMDIITLLNHRGLFMFNQEMRGWQNLLALIPVLVMIVLCWYMAIIHRKNSKNATWRKSWR